MNKKGFTLVELMAVIVLISVVALIGVSSVIGVRKQTNRKLFEDKMSSAISAAEKWGEDNKDSLETTLTIGDLIINNYYESEEAVDPKLYSYTKCSNNKSSKLGYNDGELCKNVVTNNYDNLVVNELSIKVFIKNKRVYACIEKTNNNKTLSVDFDKYSEDLYCN